jgi:hypothetical protein
MKTPLLYSIVLFAIAQTIGWFQANGQFVFETFRKYPLIWAFTIGGTASYLFAIGHKYSYTAFDGVTWPGRMIAFSAGILIFTIMAWFFLGETISLKTSLSIILALAIIAIQIAL